MNIIPRDWLPSCSMRRVICHWTAGGYQASSLDRCHYHLLIEGDGTLVRGTHSIADNVSTADGVYAAHTAGCNTGSIGVAVCCMGGAKASPFQAGRYPMKPIQWHTMARVVAELCRVYRIAVTPQTVLGHGEVEVYLGIPQGGKWDPMVLPWAPEMSRTQVGNYFRTLVQRALMGDEPIEGKATARLVVENRVVPVVLINEEAYAPLRQLAEAMGWEVIQVDGRNAAIRTESGPIALSISSVEGRGYVSCRDLAEVLHKRVEWDGSTRTVKIG